MAGTMFWSLSMVGFVVGSLATQDCPSTTIPVCNPGMFRSSTYMSRFTGEVECMWNFETNDTNAVVEITVILPQYGPGSCYLDAYDGNKITSGSVFGPFLGSMCDSQNSTLYSSGPSLTLVSYSDGFGDNVEFLIYYRQVPKRSVMSQCPDSSTGGTLMTAYNSSGTIHSINYPHYSWRNLGCMWVLVSNSEHHVVQVEILDCSEDSSESSKSNLLFYDGCNQSAPLLETNCAGAGGVCYSTGRYLTIVFKSADAVQKTGFNVQYQQVPVKRSAEFCSSSANGGYVVPSYSEPNILIVGDSTSVGRHSDCLWILEAVGQHYVIEVVFLDTSEELAQLIGVYDGDSVLSSPLEVAWNDVTPRVRSSGKYLSIRFTPAGSISSRTYRIEHRHIYVFSERTSTNISIGIIIGCVIAGAVLISLLVVAICVAVHCRRNYAQNKCIGSRYYHNV